MDQNNQSGQESGQSVQIQPATQVLGFVTSTKQLLKELWLKYSIFFIFVGILLFIAKFGTIMIKALSFLSKKELESAEKKDSQLKAQEDAANQQANQLIDEANKLPSQEGPVTEDWYKKK